MTCIVGFTDKQKNISWVGADSLGSNGYTKAINSIGKVFRNEVFQNVVIGGTTTFRHLDLLRYAKNLFEEVDVLKGTNIDHEFMVMKFIPNVIRLFREGIIHEDQKNCGGNFIIAVGGKLFEIQGDFSVLEPSLGICSVGSGEQAAMGSLLTTLHMKMKPEERLLLALEAAEKYCCGVQRPFRIICTDKNWGDNGEILI